MWKGRTVQDVLLKGLRVLVLEDEILIALDLEQICRDLGADDVVIARSLDDANALAGVVFDIAVLDVMLAGSSTVGFASGLREKGVPFVFTTGYIDPERFLGDLSDVQIVEKPFSSEALVAAIARVLEPGVGSA